MKKIVGMFLILAILLSLCGSVEVYAKTKKKATFRKKYCKQVKQLDTDDLVKMTLANTTN